jgi:hypothetical protein
MPTRLSFPRLLRPSLTDFFFVAVIFWLFLSDPGGWDRLLMDGDVGLHTRAGDYILDTGAIPKVDPFSFTKPGDRWFAFQWLSEVGFAALNRWAGLKGILLLCAAAVALAYTVLLRDMHRRKVHGVVAMILTLLVANASSIHLHARPHLFTILFFILAHYLIARDREQQSWRVWLLIPLTVLWANTHSGFPVLLLALGLLVVGQALARDWAGAKRYTIVTAACAVSTLANPNGLALYGHMAKFLGNPWLMQAVHEYQSPVFRGEQMYYYMAFLIGACVCVWPLAEKRRYADCLWILAFAAMSLQSARHIPLFLIVAAPAIGVIASEKLASIRAAVDLGTKVGSKLAPISIWSALFLAAIALWSSSFPTDLSREYFPRNIVHSEADLLATTRVFSTDQWGDYLLWANYPRQKVFIDGRSDFFQDSVGKEYVAALNAAHDWRDILEKYQVRTLLLPVDAALAEAAQRDPAWQVAARDNVAVLLTRKP